MIPSSSMKFSTYLMTTFVVLTTLSVLIILAALNLHFGKRVESEFNKKLLAQKGQVEIILKNRISAIRRASNDIVSDNIIRVTVMLSAKSQLEERLIQSYPSKNGAYHFLEKEGEASIIPENYPGISEKLID